MHWVTVLQGVKIGHDPTKTFRRKDLILFLRNLTTLIENGVALTHALETVSADRSLRKYDRIFNHLIRSLKGGESFSNALREFPAAFSETLVNQIQVGEKAGSLEKSLQMLTVQLERSSSHRQHILKKLSYPAILILAGVGSVTFMMTHVIPNFQDMYKDAGATLPTITQTLIDVSDFVQCYWSYLIVTMAAVAIAAVFLLRHADSRRWIDERIVRIPVVGDWFRDLAILQFIDVLGNLMESGFTLAEALPFAGRAISNRYVREKVLDLNLAIRRGERFSESLEREGNLFPAVVNQLVIVGERTGRLVSVTQQIQKYLRKDVENRTDAMVGLIEPILTLGLATVVGGILLAVYLPMFDLVGKVN